MSWPHFLHGELDLRKHIDGMVPNEDNHSSFMDVLDKYGIPLRVLVRFQMNVEAYKNDGFGWFAKIRQEKVYLPVLWFEEGLTKPSEV